MSSDTAAAAYLSSVPTLFHADTSLPIVRLEISKHFKALTPTERLYAHFIGRSSWAAARVISETMSHDSPALVSLFLDLFTEPSTRRSASPKLRSDMATLKATSGASDATWTLFLEYAVQVLDNLSNFRSFGDRKFVPRLPPSDFEAILAKIAPPGVASQFAALKPVIFDLKPASRCLIGFPGDGHVSGYYSPDIVKADVDLVQKALESKGLSALNTRLFKLADGSGYEIRVASADRSKPAETLTLEGGKTVKVVYGDYHEAMAAAADAMASALPHAANDNQRKMVQAYVESFRTGSMEAHRESQKHWIRDVGPIVESNIGFIETYRDPAGVRAEWEGFAAVVNKEMTLKFQKLVDGAPTFISLLPWDAAFEKDKFNKPDFTSLEVVTFATSGAPPAGINIPNYDDIRQTFGFKNVSLGNVVIARGSGKRPTFLVDDDVESFIKYDKEAFEVQVGLHELLGHGSGKLLQEEPAGQFNFDVNNPPVSPVTGKPITTWYKPGETWGSVFKAAASSYEECRAESVAMFLCVNESVLEIFGFHDKAEQEHIIYTCYLSMARKGLTALEVYDPASRKWGQAHLQARYAILQVLIQAGIVRIEHLAADKDLRIHLDGSKIRTAGVVAMGDFLQKLNIFKATADAEAGLAFYDKMTTVPEAWLAYRDIVLERKMPRETYLQCNTFVRAGGDDVELREYPLTHEGFIESFVERAMPDL